MPDKRYISMDRHERALKDARSKAARIEEKLEKFKPTMTSQLSAFLVQNRELQEKVKKLEAIVREMPESCPSCGQTPLVRYRDLTETPDEGTVEPNV